mgnify:CR=1 FL=1
MKNKEKRYFSVKNKLIGVFMLVLIISFMLLSVIIYRRDMRAADEKFMYDNNQILNAIERDTSENINKIKIMLKVIDSDLDFMNLIDENKCSEEIFKKRMMPFINDCKFITNIAIVTRGNYYMYNPDDYLSDATQLRVLFNSVDTREGVLTWFERSKNEFSNDKNIIVAASMLDVLSDNNSPKIIYIFIDSSVFFYSLSGHSTENETFSVIDKSGNLIYTTNNAEWKNIFDFNFNNLERLNEDSNTIFSYNDRVVTSLFSQTHLLKYVRVCNKKEHNENAMNIILIDMIKCFIILIVAIFLFCLYVRRMFKPINSICKQMSKYDYDNSGKPIITERNDEIGLIAASYNNMVIYTDRLIKQNSIKEKEKSIAELKAINYQINPHFLYNTLTSIKMIAVFDKQMRIADALTCLNHILRNTLSKSGKMISICDEVENIKCYMKLMNIRYDNKINIEFDIETSVVDKHILSFITQPIIENSIKHGLAKKISKPDFKSKIIFTAKSYKNLITIEIFDNGVGFDDEKIKDCLHGNESYLPYDSIGLRNINQRIKSIYGSKYGIEIESELGTYTKVLLKFPEVPEENND